MNRAQIIVLSVGVLLFSLFYFVAGTKLHKQAKIEQARTINAPSADADEIIDKAKTTIKPAQTTELTALESVLQAAQSDTAKTSALKKVSGAWYRFGKLDVSGYYAEKVAVLENTERAWFFAGSTYLTGIKQNQDDAIRQFCADRGAKAFENAISINPENVTNRVALASIYTEKPLADNPMKGILMLRELDQQHPDNPLVLVTLAKNAIRTGQYDKAVTRLENALKVAPDDNGINCLLATAYEGVGDAAKSKLFAKKCK